MHLYKATIIDLFLVLILVSLCDCRVRFKYRKRTECKDVWPWRIEDLSEIILTGVVEQSHSPTPGSQLSSASLYVKWVLKGPRQLEGSRITVDGFGHPDSCYKAVKKFDSLILPLEESAEGLYRLNGSVFRVNLNNIDRMQAIIADQPFRRRPEITDLPCETHYCPNNADCIEEPGGKTSCQCTVTCPSDYEPVCASNGETFANECRLRADSCSRGQNLFIRHLGSCDDRKRIRSLVPQYVRTSPH